MIEPLRALVRDGTLEELSEQLKDRSFSANELGEALHLAATHDRSDLAAILVAAGAPVGFPSVQASWSPLHVAVEHNHLTMAKELLRIGADPNQPADEGMTPLHLAVDVATDALDQVGVERGYGMIELLIRSGSDPQRQDDRGASPIDWAKNAEATALAQLLGRLK